MPELILTRAPAFSYAELLCTLRHMRIQRDITHQVLTQLEEQVRVGTAGLSVARHCVLLAELALMDGAIRCMWREVIKPL